MNYQNFTKPLKVSEGDYTHCPYIKIPNPFINTPIETPRNLNGEPVKELCVPNLSERNPPSGFGINTCKNNKPIHLNFDIYSECYVDTQCKQKMDTCYNP